MNYKIEKSNHAVVCKPISLGKYLFVTLVVGVILTLTSCTDSDTKQATLVVDPVVGQVIFVTADEAANTLVKAIENQNGDRLGKLLGNDYRRVLPLDDVDGGDVDNFMAAWEQAHSLITEGDNTRLLAIGDNKWTLPIPIVAGESGWYFDVEEGLERMLIRRIGRNELSAMQAVLAYHDAQMEYAEKDHNDNGKLEYAQQFVSTPKTHDGLYWEVESGEASSPLGPLITGHASSDGYHGYFYKILKAQGEHAEGGAYSYMMGDEMRSGFALIAWPVAYGESGVMSFLVNHAGLVYEQNLGPDGAGIAGAMQEYDPSPGWILVPEDSGSQVNPHK